MGLNINKFQDLPFIQKRKKLCYYLHRAITEKPELYLEDIHHMIESINQLEYRSFILDTSKKGLENFYQKIQEEILANDPYQEDILFDNPKEQRILLPQKIGIILENIRSPFNVGAFFRMAEAFGIYEIILIGMTPDPLKQQKIQKTAKGELISFRIFSSCEELLTEEKNIVLLGIEKSKGSLPMKDFQIIDNSQAHYLVFGNEEFGISSQTLSYCQTIYHIPMFGTKNSLNVSVAGGIVLNRLAELYLK